MLASSGGSDGDVVLRFPPNKADLLYVITSTCKRGSANTRLVRALKSTVQAGFQFITLCLAGNLHGCREKTGSGPLFMPEAEAVGLLKLEVILK